MATGWVWGLGEIDVLQQLIRYWWTFVVVNTERLVSVFLQFSKKNPKKQRSEQWCLQSNQEVILEGECFPWVFPKNLKNPKI